MLAPTPLHAQDPPQHELPAIAKSLDSRDDAIKHGLVLQGVRYEVRSTCAQLRVYAQSVRPLTGISLFNEGKALKQCMCVHGRARFILP